MWETVWGKDTCFRRSILESLRRGRMNRDSKKMRRRGKRGGKASLQGQGLKTASVQEQDALDIFKQETGDPCGWNRRREGGAAGSQVRPRGQIQLVCASEVTARTRAVLERDRKPSEQL